MTLSYRRDIDGLRAIAVIPVVLFHSGVTLMSGGYVGVDVFFVISGFLITAGIRKELEAGRFSIAQFYVRRIRRILPALIATVLLSTVAAWALLDPPALAGFGRSVMATTMFISNFHFWKASGYFEPAALTKPLLHTWSLAVEEQFYIVVPIAMMVFWKISPKVLKPAFIAAAAVSLIGSIVALNVAPTASFFLLPTRAWELLAGSLLALFPAPRLASRYLREGLGALGLALILFAVFIFNDATPFPGAAALLPVGGAALLIFVGSAGGSLTTRLLSTGPLVGVGLISYSLYLVHWPIIVFTRYAILRDPSGWEVIAVIAASLLLAAVFWRFIETPFRKPLRVAPPRRLFAAAAAALGALAFLGWANVASASLQAGQARSAMATPAKKEDTWLSHTCFLMDQAASDWRASACLRVDRGRPKALLWGDSFAAHYVPGILANSDRLTHDILQYTYAGCPPILGYKSFARPQCEVFNKRVFDVIRENDVKSVVISARWDQLRLRGLDGLSETITALKNRGVEVYVIGQTPLYAFDVALLDERKAGWSPGGQDASWVVSFKPGAFDEVGVQSRAAVFIDPLAGSCSGQRCVYKTEGTLSFFDYGHLSENGSRRAVAAYSPLITPASPDTASK